MDSRAGEVPHSTGFHPTLMLLKYMTTISSHEDMLPRVIDLNTPSWMALHSNDKVVSHTTDTTKHQHLIFFHVAMPPTDWLKPQGIMHDMTDTTSLPQWMGEQPITWRSIRFQQTIHPHTLPGEYLATS